MPKDVRRKSYVSRRTKNYDAYESDEEDQRKVTEENPNITCVDTEGNRKELKANLRFTPYKNIF